uniref:EF-hand domain-containing protein n=1 Tax=Globodera pallida TaxID=36090 RepID=A0A183BSI9_GLOPA
MTNAPPRNHVSELFELCDSGKKGFLTKDDLHLACPQLNEEEITFIFSCLDTNNSGSIDKAEFVAGFEETLCKGESRGFNGMQRKISTTEYFEDEDQQEVHILLGDEGAVDEGHTSNVANGTFNYPRKRPKPPRLTKDQTFKVPPQMTLDIPCKEEVLQLYEELQSSGVPQIMSRFEEVVGNLCREIDHKRDENERLQHQQKAERESYNKRMAALENEIDQQLLVAEKKAREEERERLAKEKEELKERLEREMGDLQTNIEHLQKMEKMLKKEAQKNGNQDKLKEKLEEIARENRTLKNNLAENHLEMTLIKAELVEIKSEYENRTLLMALEQEHEQPSAAEAQQIQRQLQLLYDANKRLHDTNDNLRGALDQRTSAIKQLNMLHQHPSLSAFLSPYSRNDSLMSFPDSSATSPPHLQTPDDDNDSGFPPRTYGAGSRATSSVSDHDLFRCASASVDTVSPVPMTLDQQLMMAKQFTANGNAMALQEFTGPPDRTFRVVMCGDAAVGKSSIIMRIVKGIFQTNIASTLGVDFHVKSVRVGEQNIAVQLWDTAGQERFRSLCNSYFRRADGAILVYDCSIDRSFLRIRDWIETVKDSTMKEVPILLVGNKVDLRNVSDDLTTNDAASSFVTRKEGENLSELLGTDFIETSALDGTNVETALLLLVGEMLKTEDDQLKQTAMMLQNAGKLKKSKCLSCGNS